MKVIFCLLFTCIIHTATYSQVVKGQIKDAETNEPLPFATVAFQGTTIGTISNGKGIFELSIPQALESTSLIISYLGYESGIIDPKNFSEASLLQVNLKPSVLTLAELVIRPLSPEDYIKRVVRNKMNAAPEQPFGSKGYYREKFMENGGYLAYTEGIFKSYYPKYQDTIKNQHQLMLYETAENPQEIQFMQDKAAKKAERKKKKAEKNGETYDDESTNMIQASFGGPNEILGMDWRKDLEDFLDSTKFKKFRYSFADPVRYQDRELLAIDFESKGTYEHMKTKGRLYIDLESDAFALIDYKADLVIPIVVQPILLAFGLSIKDPVMVQKQRYQYQNGFWYPEYFYVNVDLTLKKRHMFSENEISDFYIEQLMKLDEINTTNPMSIPKEKRYKSDKPVDEQVFNDENLNWSDINRLNDEAIIGSE